MVKDLIRYREEQKKLFALVSFHYSLWEPDGGHAFTHEKKMQLIYRVKDLRRATSELLQSCRLDKKYG